MLDPQRLAWDMSALRAARERRRIKADLILAAANPEAGGADVIQNLVYEIYLDGLHG